MNGDAQSETPNLDLVGGGDVVPFDGPAVDQGALEGVEVLNHAPVTVEA